MEMNADLQAQRSAPGRNKDRTLSVNDNECINQVCAWYELFMAGKLPNRRAYHVSFFWKDK